MSVQGGLALARHALALWVAGMGRGMGVYIHALRGLVRVDTRRCVFDLMQGVSACGTPVSHKVSGRDVPDDAVVIPKSACNRNQLAEETQKAFREQ